MTRLDIDRTYAAQRGEFQAGHPTRLRIGLGVELMFVTPTFYMQGSGDDMR